MNQPNPPPAPVQGSSLTPLDRFWLETARNAAKESVGAIEEAAKQVIAINTFVQTVYFAAISFGDVKKAIGQPLTNGQWVLVGLLVIPIVFWIFSLWSAVRVFKPEIYHTNLNSPDMARDTYLQIVTYKHDQLQTAYIALVIGFIPLLFNIILYLLIAPVAPK